jgi:hypothetical protein
MGVLELLISTVSQAWSGIRFVLKLMMGNRANLEFLTRFFRGPNPKQKLECKRNARASKNKFRPKQIVGADGDTRLAEPGERGGSLYRTLKASVGKEISEFGIGIGLFFGLMIGYFFLLLVQFGVLLPSALFYSRPEYR